MTNIFALIQIVVALLLTVAIIMQSRGTTSGVVFGGGSETYRSKKGVEKFLFYGTIALCAIFASISILSLLIK